MSHAALVAFRHLTMANNYVYIYDKGPGFNGWIHSHSNGAAAAAAAGLADKAAATLLI